MNCSCPKCHDRPASLVFVDRYILDNKTVTLKLRCISCRQTFLQEFSDMFEVMTFLQILKEDGMKVLLELDERLIKLQQQEIEELRNNDEDWKNGQS